MALAAAPALILAGCSAEEPSVPDGPQTPGTPLGVTASISGRLTRAYGTTWEAGDAVMISCIGYKGTDQTGFDNSPMKGYIGSRYVTAAGTTADGTAFKAEDALKAIYFKDIREYKFCAVYPAFDPFESDGTTPKTYALDTSISQVDRGETGADGTFPKSSIDVMCAEGTGSALSPDVVFNFTHRMAQLQLNFKLDTNEGFQEDETATLDEAWCMLQNLRLTGYVTHTGAITVNDNVTFLWNPVQGSAKKTIGNDKHSMSYSLILLPQTVDNFNINFSYLTNPADEMSSISYKLVNDISLPLESGKVTTLNVTVKKSRLEITSVRIIPWNEEEKDEVKVTA